MKPKIVLPTLLVSVCCVLLSGCMTAASNLVPSRMAIISAPSQAMISIDGKVVGTAPLNVWLSNTRPHLIVAEKEDWVRTAALVLPATASRPSRLFLWNEDSDLAELMNYDSWTIDLWLKSSPESEKFAGYMREVLLADEMEKAGRLTKNEHRELVRQITEFFAPSAVVTKN